MLSPRLYFYLKYCLLYTSQIRQANLKRANNPGGDSEPLVITLGYNVHGNEPSSSEAAMLTAYYLVANQSAETKTWLEGLVILLDPNYNPDGRDRHSHWANMHKGTPNVLSLIHI